MTKTYSWLRAMLDSVPLGPIRLAGLTVTEHSWDDFEHVVMEGN